MNHVTGINFAQLPVHPDIDTSKYLKDGSGYNNNNVYFAIKKHYRDVRIVLNDVTVHFSHQVFATA